MAKEEMNRNCFDCNIDLVRDSYVVCDCYCAHGRWLCREHAGKGIINAAKKRDKDVTAYLERCKVPREPEPGNYPHDEHHTVAPPSKTKTQITNEEETARVDAMIPPPLPGEFTIEDSGEREEFDSGSVRDTRTGKGRFDLMSPIANRRMAQHYENGAKKYSGRNWEKGQKLSRYYDSALRHMNTYLEGGRTEDHLAAAAWNIWAMIHTEEMIKRNRLPKELNDMPDYTPLPEEGDK